jgi:hypothetical protein
MTLSLHDPEILHRRGRKRKPPGELKITFSKLQGIFDRKECGLFMIRSLTPPQAAGNALAFAVQPLDGAGRMIPPGDQQSFSRQSLEMASSKWTG